VLPNILRHSAVYGKAISGKESTLNSALGGSTYPG
jgi:hypothetical protein